MANATTSEPTNAVAAPLEAVPTAERPLFAWLTWELALYGLVLALGLVLRLGALSVRLMDVSEAEQAVQALQLATGGTPAGRWSPLLLSGQALLFALFGASDGAARLLPALAGSLIVLLPFYLRSLVGRIGALVAALALAISPTMVYSARYGDGVTLLVFCFFGALAFWQAYREKRQDGYLYGIAVLSALGLLADPRVVGLLLAGLLAWTIERFALKRDLFALEEDASLPWRDLALCFGGTFVLVATGLSLNPGGLGAWADMLSAWFEHLAPVVNGQPPTYALLSLALYEPFLLLFGLLGAVTLVVERRKMKDREELSFYLWLAAGLILLALLAGGRGVGDVALVCVPLALLAGWIAERLAINWQACTSWARDLLLAVVVLVIVLYVAMQVAFYARAVYTNAPQASQFMWFWILAVALLVLLGGFSVAWLGSQTSWRVGGVVLALVLLSASFSAGTRLNWERPNDPSELHVRVAADIGLRDALDVAADLGYHRWGAAVAIPVTVEKSLGAVWSWYLRDWEHVTWVDALSSDVSTPMVLSAASPAGSSAEESWSPADRYIGQDFVTRAWWEPAQLFANDRLSWVLYRNTMSKPTPLQRVVIWMSVQED